ncbi:MAG: alpha/beta fold hydrolase [Bryobacterales bacterium]
MPSVRIPKWVGWPLLVLWTYFVLSLLVQWSMFHPEQYPGGLWHLQEHFKAEDVWLTTSDGVRIHGWKLRARPHAEQSHAEWVTLYLHGNAGNLTHRVDHMETIPRVGSDLLIIDYRGYGKSEGKPTEEGIYRDADAAYEYLVEAGYRPENLVVYGESLGTAVAVDLASRRECAGVVLEAPFPSASAVASSVLPLLGPLAARGYLETAKKLPRVKAPVLVIHGTKDQVIDHELGRAVFEAAPEPKQFWSVEGARHSDILEVAREQYPARLSEFFDQLRVR